MSISVAMTTYNGEKYVRAQLDSLRLQSAKPDEVVILDDCSTDNTPEIVSQYINEFHLQNWHFFENEKNAGWIKNFYNAISKCSGDYIFFSDQDDVWDTEKIKVMSEILDTKPEINVLSCVLNFIDQDGNEIEADAEALPYGKRKAASHSEALPYGRRTKAQMQDTSNIEVQQNGNGTKSPVFDLESDSAVLIKNTFDDKFIYTIMPGCSMAVRRSFFEILKNTDAIDFDVLPHDALFWKMGTLLGCANILNMPLVKYRIHSENASTPSIKAGYKKRTKESRIRDNEINLQKIKNVREVYRALLMNEENTATPLVDNKTNSAESHFEYSDRKLPILDDMINFCIWRENLIQHKINILTPRFFHFKKYYRNARMVAGDLLAR